MVLLLSAETLDTVKVLEPKLEDKETRKISILKLETEDVPVETITSSNAESMVDQTKMTRVLKLMSDAQEDHGHQSMLKQARNSE
jgi:hypothetical protein